MRIRRLQIENFRGIKKLDWILPSEQRLIALVGVGDSCKTTILDAVHYLLGDRWNIPFSDTDFFRVDISQPILIKGVLVDLPDAIRKESAFGLWMSGIDTDAKIYQDPEDEYTPALIVHLSVDSTLEPKWMVERVNGDSQILTSSQRSHFSTFKVDDRTDTQLRWTRTSALGRLSAKEGGEREALAEAARSARESLSGNQNTSLANLAKQVQDKTNSIGGGHFSDIRPGLDTSRSSLGAGLALYEDTVPLTSYGLGTRRLASFAIQQLAAGDRAVAVVDEIENGLEPHRAVKLLEYLLTDESYSQVLVTTHSPVIVEQARVENLAVVTSADGAVSVVSLMGSDDKVQQVRRSRPSSLLARRIVVSEGATEYGLLMELVRHWDEKRVSEGLSTSAGQGLAIQHGEGGSEVAPRVSALRGLGYEAAGLMDNDDRTVDSAVATSVAEGALIIRWDDNNNLEQQLVSQLDTAGLSSLLEVAVLRRNDERTVLNDLARVRPDKSFVSLAVAAWMDDSFSLENARDLLAKAAVESKWFKEVDGGRALGTWLANRSSDNTLANTIEKLEQLKPFIYPSQLAQSGEPSDG